MNDGSKSKNDFHCSESLMRLERGFVIEEVFSFVLAIVEVDINCFLGCWEGEPEPTLPGEKVY